MTDCRSGSFIRTPIGKAWRVASWQPVCVRRIYGYRVSFVSR
jgi:hypothetical protein